MFFCEKCREKNKWPESFHKSMGPCEVCGKASRCNDVPSKYLSVKRLTPETPDAILDK